METLHLIWDLDGTLFDTYPAIVTSIYKVFLSHNIEWSTDEIERCCKQYSLNEVMKRASEGMKLPFDDLMKEYKEIVHKVDVFAKPIPQAEELLKVSIEKGSKNYIVTHRGKTSFDLLKNNQMESYFEEVVTSENGFPRKPESDAIRYLMNKYDMQPENTFYIGDRNLDMECANKAEISGILYLPEDDLDIQTDNADYIVTNLMDIDEILDMMRC